MKIVPSVGEISCMRMLLAVFAVLCETPIALALALGDGGMRDLTLDYDPSLVAVTNDCRREGSTQPYLERLRIITDLNGDGVSDMILSEPRICFGTGGGCWSAYVSSNGFWCCVGEIGMCPGWFALENRDDVVDLWSYWRSSAREGSFGYYTFGRNGLRDKMEHMLVRYSEDGDDGIMHCIDKGVFGCVHNHPYTYEESTTAANGVVTWNRIGDWRHPFVHNEAFDLRRQLAETQGRLAQAEERLRRAQSEIESLKRKVPLGIGGVAIGSRWMGGELSRTCEEVVPGFTNITIRVDDNGCVSSIRAIRTEKPSALNENPADNGEFPIEEEERIVHDIENNLYARFRRKVGPGEYRWENLFDGTLVRLKLVNGGESWLEISYLAYP